MSDSKAIVVQAPTNIALLKYWGKKDATLQWPANSSLSMTLKNSCTTAVARLARGSHDTFFYHGSERETQSDPTPMQVRVLKHLAYLRRELGFSAPLEIHSRNNFPRECGIASSASAYAAITLAAIACWHKVPSLAELDLLGFSRARLADLARAGSGSACRSLFSGFVEWQHGVTANAQKVTSLHSAAHWKLCDIIVVLSQQAKAHSSREGHQLAWTSPLFQTRLAGINEKMQRFKTALATKNFADLGMLLEQEALEMHAVMMTSETPLRYLEPMTLQFMQWLREQRASGGFPAAYFTADAGANLHILCEEEQVQEVQKAIAKHWGAAELIIDQIGDGPTMQWFDGDPQKL